jgi:hypothetical protein
VRFARPLEAFLGHSPIRQGPGKAPSVKGLGTSRLIVACETPKSWSALGPIQRRNSAQGGGSSGHGFKEQFLGLNQQKVAYYPFFAYWAQMPARRTPDKSKPIAFDCPSCGAKYIIATTDIVNGVQRSKLGCLKCDALFPAGVGQVSLEYIPLDGDANE